MAEDDPNEPEACTDGCALAPREGRLCHGHAECLVQRIRRLQRNAARSLWDAAAAARRAQDGASGEVVLDFVPNPRRAIHPAD